MSRLRIAVIGGGANSEHDVSVASAASVTAALDPSRYEVLCLTIGRDGVWWDAAGSAVGLGEVVSLLQGCAVVFPAVHGPRGEDGTLAALLDLAGVPYVGSGVRAGALGMDKWTTKLVAEAVGVRTAPGLLVTRTRSIPTDVTLPVVVKPVAAGSSHGVTRVDRPDRLPDAIGAALALDDRALVESYISGREIDIAVLACADGRRIVSAPLEIVVADGLFDTARKYDGTADFRVPARLTPDEQTLLEQAALAIFDALGCAGAARIDFFLTDAGLVLNEVNTMPGMTAQSQVPRMFAARGLTYPQLLDELVRAAMTAA